MPDLKLDNLTAQEFLTIIEQLLDTEKPPRSGIEKGVLLSDSSPYALMIYNTGMVPQEAEEILPKRMEKFARLGNNFSTEHYPSDTVMEGILRGLPAVLEKSPNKELAQKVHAIVIEAPEATNRNPIIALQANLCQPNNGAFDTVDAVLKNNSAVTLTPETKENLIINLLSSYALAEAAELVIWDTKADNLMTNSRGELRVIDLGPSSYRLRDTIYDDYAQKDPRHWEKIRLAYVISDLLKGQNHEPPEALDHEACSDWAAKRLQLMAKTGIHCDADAIIKDLCVGLKYLTIMEQWLKYAEQKGNQSLSEKLSESIKITSPKYQQINQDHQDRIAAEYPEVKETKNVADSIKRRASATLAEAAAIRELIPSDQTDLLTKFDDIIGNANDAGQASLRKQFEILCTLAQDRSSTPLSDDNLIMKRIREYKTLRETTITPYIREYISQTENRLEEVLDLTSKTSAHQSPDNNSANDEIASPMQQLKALNGSFNDFKRRQKHRSSAIIGAVLLALIGSGGASYASYCLLTSQDPLTFGILLATSCVIALLSAWPAVAAHRAHITTFAKHSHASQILQEAKQFSEKLEEPNPAP